MKLRDMEIKKNKALEGKKIFLTGGTGSLGRAFLEAVLTGQYGNPDFVTVFSRDEAKQFYLQADLDKNGSSSDSIIYKSWRNAVRFIIGDVRSLGSLKRAMHGHDTVIHAAALKQVPSCELFPIEAMKTNCIGASNVVTAVEEVGCIEKCIFISTDKAAKPTNAMGISKALQEKIFIAANRIGGQTIFAGVRYGNVISSRGSVVPVFVDQIKRGEPITITDTKMTRFLLSLDEAVETIVAAICCARSGDIVVPNARSAKILDLISALTPNSNYPVEIIGVRPGEKLHEIMIGFEESLNLRKIERQDDYDQEFYIICSCLPHLGGDKKLKFFEGELSSENSTMSVKEIRALLSANELAQSNK